MEDTHMTNLQVIKAFINGQVAKTQHLRSTGTELINYSTCIAKKDTDKYIVSTTKYSNTTTVIQNKLKAEIPSSKLVLQEMGW
jgi:hypothetical protein